MAATPEFQQLQLTGHTTKLYSTFAALLPRCRHGTAHSRELPPASFFIIFKARVCIPPQPQVLYFRQLPIYRHFNHSLLLPLAWGYTSVSNPIYMVFKNEYFIVMVEMFCLIYQQARLFIQRWSLLAGCCQLTTFNFLALGSTLIEPIPTIINLL